MDHIPVTPVNFTQSFRTVYKTLYSARKVLISKRVKQQFIASSWIKSFWRWPGTLGVCIRIQLIHILFPSAGLLGTVKLKYSSVPRDLKSSHVFIASPSLENSSSHSQTNHVTGKILYYSRVVKVCEEKVSPMLKTESWDIMGTLYVLPSPAVKLLGLVFWAWKRDFHRPLK